ncbi:AI-2E family transporter [Methylocystis echinoides]|uniref:AI-2E family transporter n=1 Tax=Methylocystis echinoides TaxID=29468 RepID=UPI00342E22D2
MFQNRIVTAASIVMLVFVVLAACKIAEAVIEPAVFGLFVVILAWPLQNMLQKRLGKAAALSLTVVCASAIVLALVSIVMWSAGEVAHWLRQNLDLIQDSLFSVSAWLERHDISLFALLAEQFSGPALIPRLQAFALRANSILAFSLIVIVYVILGLAEADYFLARISALRNRETSVKLLACGANIQKKFRSYIYVRTVASVATGLATWALARYVGLELALAWGVLAFALNYLPYLGSFITVVSLPIFALVQFGTIGAPLMVLLGLMAINFIIGSLLEPAFSGAALSISPPVVLFAIILWTFLWGPVGAFLGIPLAIAILSAFEQFEPSRWIAALLSSGPPEAVPVYQNEDRV